MVTPCSMLSTQLPGGWRKIGSIQALALAHALKMIKSVGQHGVGVEKKSTNQSRFAVVNRARRRSRRSVRPPVMGFALGAKNAEDWIIRSSPPVFDPPWRPPHSRSSAPCVAPRSVSWLSPTSLITSCTVFAADSTAAVQDMSPTVR